MASGNCYKRRVEASGFDMEDIELTTNWEEVLCPVCLDFPHNSVLLQCSSYEKGCRPFVCDTNHLHSNCLDRFKAASGMSSPSTPDVTPTVDTHAEVAEADCKLACPLCRGVVTGWVVVDKARVQLDQKKRHCEEDQCKFFGTYSELCKHAQLEHPHARPSKIDPARQLDWENFQQSSEIIDVLSTIHSEIPRGVVLGDYVIEYGDDDADEFDDFRGDEGNWWTSCILYQVFDNLRHPRNRRRRSRVADTRRGSSHQSYDTSNSDDASVTSVEFADNRLDEIEDDFASTDRRSRGSSGHRSSRRRPSRFYDN